MDSFGGKAICSICYDDLKPIVEDLQVIAICGHVFHELCIQETFEFFSKGKKKCPICKQTCSASDVSRLYFQSVDDSNDSQKPQTHKEDPNELKLEVRRLEGKNNELNLALERRENDLKNINNEVIYLTITMIQCTYSYLSIILLTTFDLNKSELERIKLQETNTALAKELAALRLVSDFNLKENEIVKLASLDEPRGKHSVDILSQILVSRNKAYMELMTKYKTLEKNEARSPKELEKLKKKIKKTETAKETKENEMDPTSACTPRDTIKEPSIHLGKTKRLRACEVTNESSNKDVVGSCILIDDDDDAPKVSVSPNSSSNDSFNNKDADFCFSAGLLGPGGTQRHLGKWCKKSQSKGFNASFMQTQASDDLVSVGPDGRGGTINILKSQNPISLNFKGSLSSANSDKNGSKASISHSRGSSQIKHFYSKTGQYD
ncbi:uncharacterized protein LOC143540916 [Bidens hawaiensis]|uniref:uncharacterized protein LOC143540916 n=1 Tax=Bidens hawaiensis TaxID=980011 RepID=UPI00404AF439